MPTQGQRFGRIGVGLLIAAWVILGICTFVVPRLETVFRELDAALPDLTEWVLDFSHWLANGRAESSGGLSGFTLLTPILAVIGIALVVWLRRQEQTSKPEAADSQQHSPAMATLTLGLWMMTGVVIVAAVVLVVALGLPLLRVVSP